VLAVRKAVRYSIAFLTIAAALVLSIYDPRGRPPDWPQWSEGGAGVRVLDQGELVAISVIVTKRRDP
jgi:hypothetical protein